MSDFKFQRSQANRSVTARLNSELAEANRVVGLLRERLGSMESAVLDRISDSQRRAAQRAALEEELRRSRPIRPAGAL